MDIQKIKKNPKQENLELKKLREELKRVKKESEDYKNKYLRALADYQNYENRISEEKRQISLSTVSEIVLKLLPFLDDLEKAEAFVKDKGLKLIKDRFCETLREVGIEETQILGKLFDPHIAEAIEVVDGKEDNIIKEVLRKGYIYKGKVLRVAQVKVTKQNPKS